MSLIEKLGGGHFGTYTSGIGVFYLSSPLPPPFLNSSRFYCTFLGRWPLIPDLWFDVKLPLESFYPVTVSNPTVPTPFTDVLLNIKICQFMESFLSAPVKKAERLDPARVSEHARKFQGEFLDKLPSAFRLHNPDMQWDALIPCLSRKRAAVHLLIWMVIESMYRGFIGTCNSTYVGKDNVSLDAEPPQIKWTEAHRRTLANACINALDVTAHLHDLMGGWAHRYFVLSMAPMEAGSVLAICLLSDSLALRSRSGQVYTFDHELQERCYASFLAARRLLDLLAKKSALAQKGVVLLRKLHTALVAEGYGRSASAPAWVSPSLQTRNDEVDLSGDGETMDTIPDADEGTYCFGQQAEPLGNQDIFTLGEWETISQGADFSWFFGGNFSTEDLNVEY